MFENGLAADCERADNRADPYRGDKFHSSAAARGDIYHKRRARGAADDTADVADNVGENTAELGRIATERNRTLCALDFIRGHSVERFGTASHYRVCEHVATDIERKQNDERDNAYIDGTALNGNFGKETEYNRKYE